MKTILLSSLICGFAFLSISCGGGGTKTDLSFGVGQDQDSGSNDADEPAADTEAQVELEAQGRIWSVAEILAEPRGGGFGNDASCGGEFGFKRCICAYDVPADIRYRPAVLECNGSAAAILSGRYLDSFSIVVRDSQNRDRWPEAGSGFGGCSFDEADRLALNRCSAFKVQSQFEIGSGSARVHCFGASGYSEIFRDAVRLTVKLSDLPSSSNDPLERFCLNGADQSLN